MKTVAHPPLLQILGLGGGVGGRCTEANGLLESAGEGCWEGSLLPLALGRAEEWKRAEVPGT